MQVRFRGDSRGRLVVCGGRTHVRAVVGILATVCSLFAMCASSEGALVHPYVSQITGENKSHSFSALCGINIDPTSGEVFAVDEGKIDVFDSTNKFLRKIRKLREAEDSCSTAANDTNHRLYVANPGESTPEQFFEEEVVWVYDLVGGKYERQAQLTLTGSNTPAKTFEGEEAEVHEGGGGLHVAFAQKSTQPNSEDLYVADESQGVVDQFNSAGEYLKQLPITSGGEPTSITVSSAGDVYVVIGTPEREITVNEYDPAGELLATIVGTEAGGFGELKGLAVDAAGDVYVSDSTNEVVDEFDPSGHFMGRLNGSGSPKGEFIGVGAIAVNPQDGELYVENHGPTAEEQPPVIEIFGEDEVGAGPFLETEAVSDVAPTSALLEAKIDPTGLSTSYHFEYGPQGGPYSSTPQVGLGGGQTPQHVSYELQGLLANTTYEYRVVVSVSGASAECVALHEPESECGSLKAFTTKTEGAGLTLPDGRAWELVTPVNKYGSLIEGIGAQGVVQASADGDRIAFPAASPLEPNPAANIGHAQALAVRGTQEWNTSEIMPPTYPQVGPASISAHGDENRIFSDDVTRSLVDPFREEPMLSPQASERTPYLRNLNLTGANCQITESACFLPLATATGELADVTSGAAFGGQKPEIGPSAINGQIQAVAASADLNQVLLQSAVPLKNRPESEAEASGTETRHPYPETEEGGVYEWNATSPASQRLQLVSLLPASEGGGQAPATTTPHAGIDRKDANMRHAVSPDGSLVVWSATKEAENHKQEYLYLRDTAIGQTIRLDTPKAGEPPEGMGATYQTASADDSTIFFTDEQQLTADSKAVKDRPDLYACHVRIVGGQLECPPEDLTVSKSGESGDVRGLVIEASEDGSDVYFVADGVLSSNKNAQGEEASAGQCGEAPPLGATCNLYMEHYSGSSWEEPRFIAALSADDGPDWAASPSGGQREKGGTAIVLSGLTGRVSPNGRFLAFMSDRRLTGYDNSEADPNAAGAVDEEVFLYDSSTNRLVCASCDPTGARPHGLHDLVTAATSPLVDAAGDLGTGNVWEGSWLAGNIPGWTPFEVESALYQSRYLSNEGRLFFNSPISLVPQDKNSVEDVYEYEPSAVGTCGSAPGCVSLISSGESSDESAFLDASESGGDVFFLTLSKLVPQDVDQSYDIYDAHDCNESACLNLPTHSESCTSSASCQGSSTSSTSFASPVSSSNPGVAPANEPKHETLHEIKKQPTRAQLLAKALKSCKKLKKKKKRVACEKTARKKYGPKSKKKKKQKSKKASAR
jgi:hypothetical protein